MRHVFVSHAKEDQDAASRVCEMLEADGTHCWLASRDSTAETERGAEILEAIRSSDLVLLVFSAAANASPSVLREVERAVAYERPVFSVRVDDATPNVSLQHYLNLALQPGSMASPEIAERLELGPHAEAARRRRPSRRTWGIALGATLLVVAIALGLGLGLTRTVHQGMWTQLSPSGTLPLARASHSMANDSSHGLMIVFGGAGETGLYPDTWAYDPSANTWTELRPSGTLPSARASHSMAYEPVTHRLIMFGGYDEEYGSNGLDVYLKTSANDTWAYDPVGNTWTNLDPAGDRPAARIWHTMVHDSDTGKLIMFGGMGGGLRSLGAVLVGDDLLNDTWAYDPGVNTWTNLNPTGPVPAARGLQAMAYDPSTQKVILFGGGTATALFNDTWAYDPGANTWTNLNPTGPVPAGRGGQVMAYDSSIRKVILFGGGTTTTRFNDTWAYDPAANTWTKLAPAGTAPTPRGAPTMAYDPGTRQLLMFGGSDEADTGLNDTWVFTP
jgi:N-acetylneuraminic acid mutarotase